MLKLGIIGCGSMGKAHFASCKDSPLIKVEAVCDVVSEAAEALAAGQECRAYHSVTDMLQQEKLDAVVIATPDTLHKEPFIECADAGLAIMLEKPFATTLEDAHEMLAAIERNHTPVQMAHLFRFLPFYLNMKNAASSGALGELVSADAVSTNRIFVPTKMLKWAASSSPSWFLLSHSIDAIMWINGSRGAKVRASGVKKKLAGMGIDTYDIIKAEVVLKNGCLCSFEANWILPDTYPIMAGVTMSVTGTEGTISTNTADPIMQLATQEAYSIPGILEYDIGGYHVGLRRNMLEAFARTVLNGTEPLAAAQDGYETLRILCAIDESLANGGREILL